MNSSQAAVDLPLGPGLAAWLFWFATTFVAYAYFGYPVIAALMAKIFARPVRSDAGFDPRVTIVVAAYNEGHLLRRRVENLLAQDYPPDKFDIVIVSDGSSDRTPDILRELATQHDRLRALHLERNQGKAGALNAAMELATGEIVVYADARQVFAPDVVRRLVENFADPTVGSASGELILLPSAAAAEQGETSASEHAFNGEGVAAQVGLYWRYEKWIRRSESTFGSMLGATGAIYAIRRELWKPLPIGTLLDDFLNPMRIVLAGYRAVFDGRARAYDRPSERAGQEFRRKARTLAGNFQALALEPGLLWPWSNPATWWQLWSHKIFRLLVPYALGTMLVSSFLAPGWFYLLTLLAQVLFYGLALAGCLLERRGRPVRQKAISLAYTFVTLNLAAVAGLSFWISGRDSGSLWRKAYAQDSQKSAR